jgi:hypothetical protein
MLKNVNLSNKWWIQIRQTINYLRNRFSVTNRSIISYKIFINSKLFLNYLKRVEIKDLIMIRKSSTKWQKLQNQAFKITLFNYEKNHIYRMLISKNKVYRVQNVIWKNQKRFKKIIDDVVESFAKKQVIKSLESIKSISIIISWKISIKFTISVVILARFRILNALIVISSWKLASSFLIH